MNSDRQRHHGCPRHTWSQEDCCWEGCCRLGSAARDWLDAREGVEDLEEERPCLAASARSRREPPELRDSWMTGGTIMGAAGVNPARWLGLGFRGCAAHDESSPGCLKSATAAFLGGVPWKGLSPVQAMRTCSFWPPAPAPVGNLQSCCHPAYADMLVPLQEQLWM